MIARNVIGGMACLFLSTAPDARAADRDFVEDSDFTKTVGIHFSGTTATIANGAGVSIVSGTSSSHIVIDSSVEGVEYILSGASEDGYVEIASTYASKVTLQGVDLASSDGPAVSLLSEARSFVVLASGSTNALTDSGTYTRSGSGTLYSAGPLIFSGKGSLEVTGVKSHAIYSGTSLRVLGGDVTVSAAAKDAMHANTYFQMDQGSLMLTADGDGIDADEGYVVINGGGITILSTEDDTKGIGCDGTLTINGGFLHLTADGDQSKALKCDSDITIAGGALLFQLSGGASLETIAAGSGSYVDPSYCTAIKCDSNLTILGGELTVIHTGLAGKGISVDGNITISGGTLDLATSGGNSSSFTNEDGEPDMASADCMKADGNLTITGGTITATSTGNGADAISCDGVAIIGVLGTDDTPVISAHTSGARILLSGSGENADYVNPKAFKAGGNLTMNGGVFRATTQQNGGEGMESKAALTIAGGTVEITAYDDCINAADSITISGGKVYCYSAGNDGIDSNGTIRVTGGTIISSGTNSPEEGFDCDQNNFTITGGILVGTGGATSTPTASTSTQRSVIYRGAGTANVILQVRSSNGDVLVYKIPRTYSGGGGGNPSSAAMTMLFSNPSLASGTTYTIVSGATVSGGTEFHGLSTGATVTGGTTLRTFTASSMVTTVQ